MLQKNENIKLVELFIEGIKEKNIDKLPLHENVLLYSPLKPGHVIKGRDAMREFLSTKAFPSLPITGANIEKHISKEHCVCTLWELCVNDIKIPIFDYFEIKDNLISTVRPYFDPAPLKQFL